MKKNFLLGAMSAIASLSLTSVNAQEGGSPMDTLTQNVMKLNSKVDAMSKLKFSGYIQGQFQMADSMGAKSFAGGDFGATTDKRFMLRRARLKAQYDGNLSQFVFQIDVSEKGFAIKDLYAKVTEPWMKSLSLTVGMQNRPFGYEIGYSSSMRESPERGRMSQIIFPNERDLGAMVTFQRPKGKSFDFLKIEAGMFNGTGAPGQGANTSDFDFQKDFIGRIRIDKTTKNEKISYGVGASYYNGGWRQGTSTVWDMKADSNGTMAFYKNKDTSLYGKIARRMYGGFDAQISIDFPFGMTTLRAEYIQGQQPATSSSTTSPNSQPVGSATSTANLTTGAVTTVTPNADVYFRNFNGAYFYFIQNIMHSKFDVIAKYDWYDPNTDVAGNDIGKAILNPKANYQFVKTGTADLKYTTVGLGLIFKVDANVKFTAYYDMVTNETSNATTTSGTKTTWNLGLFHKDVLDNVLTLRMQYKF